VSALSPLVAFVSQRFPKLSSRVLASSGYTLNLSSFGGPDDFSVWNEATAERQDRAWQAIVDDAKKGRVREDVAALFDALALLGDLPLNLLEVGCGGGYYSELIRSRFSRIDYRGVDISEPMIAVAKTHYPGVKFDVGSAYDLEAANDSVDVVLDGVALIHMDEWKRAIAEYSRVAKSAVVLHGLTLTDTSPTTTFAKYAYGQPSTELVFSRAELLKECSARDLIVRSIQGGLDYDLERYVGIKSVSETWLLGKN
jgi:ubiquinone/menaquinone biosynthesis C-methylase UbiE